MIYELHVHSRYSHDSLLNSKKILRLSKEKFNGVAIVDHNTIRGELEAIRINEDKDFHVVIGAEIRTDLGDIIGLFIDK